MDCKKRTERYNLLDKFRNDTQVSKMVRQRPRKSVEELYGAKYPGNVVQKEKRNDRDYGNFVVTSTAPYPPGMVNAVQMGSAAAPPSSLATGRRRTARQGTAKGGEKYNDKMILADEAKKEHPAKVKTARTDKGTYNNGQNGAFADGKNFAGFPESMPKEGVHPHPHAHTHMHAHPHPHHHHHHHHPMGDEEKDDDTEEFFDLIRQTVEGAIGKAISEVLNRNFRELSAKVDYFSTELKATNANLAKLQNELNNKVVHYGEENSRHFRYLCMKSEYDKMFYQHQTMLAGPPSADKRSNGSEPSGKGPVGEPEKPPCSCHPSKSHTPRKTSSETLSVSQKSSEMGMREVLEHIQRFCNQMQLTETKGDDNERDRERGCERMCDRERERGCERERERDRSSKSGAYRLDDIKVRKQVFEDDDDEYQLSSDGMTPRSEGEQEAHPMQKYGGVTTRGAIPRPCNGMSGGGGDA